MITPQELRINNWVCYAPDDTHFQVTEIHKDGLSIKNHIEETWVEIDEFEPIPLTLGWLNKLGLVYWQRKLSARGKGRKNCSAS